MRRALVRNTVAGWANNLISVGGAVAVTPLIIDRVGAPAYGIWALVSQFAGYAGLLDLGVQPAVTKHVADARVTGNRDGLKRIFSSALVLHSCIACVVLAALATLSFFFDRCFNLGDIDRNEARTALILAGVGAAVGFPASVFSAGLRGYLRYDLVNYLGIVSNLTRMFGVLLAISMGSGIVGLAWAGLAANLVGLIGGIVVFGYEAGKGIFAWSNACRREIRLIMSFGAFSFLGSLGWYMAYASDAMVIGVLASPSDVAHFGLAANVMVIVGGITSSFAITFMPVASGMNALDDQERLGSIYLIGTRVALFLTIPSILVFLIDGTDLLSLWVGPDFGVPAGRLLKILAIAHLPTIVNGPGLQIAIGKGLQRPAAAISLLEGLANLALSVALGLRWGAIGVAAATMVVSIATHAILWPSYLKASLGFSARRYWAEVVIPASIPVVPALLMHQMAVVLLSGHSGWPIPLAIRCLAPPFALASSYLLASLLIYRASRPGLSTKVA